MAIVNFVNYPSRSQTRAGMRGVMEYAAQQEKTLWEGRQLVTGVNCQAQSAYDDFLNTKLLYHKDGGRMFYHLVQSFPSCADVDPVTAHAAALKLAEFFKDHEVLVCTHTDRDHIHSHLVINSVNFETGRKLHVASEMIDQLKIVNDQICTELGLPVLEPQEPKKVRPAATAEYHAAAKGGSWKYQLMSVIDGCMARAATREEFISLMRSEGCDVKWTDTRKNITYTTPTSMRCRDDRLHEEKYLKENMEHEFTIRQKALQRGAESPEQTSPLNGSELDSGIFAPQWSAPASGADGKYTRDADDNRASSPSADTADGGAEQCESQPPVLHHTGWEDERELFFKRRKLGDDFEESHLLRSEFREDVDRCDSPDLDDLGNLADGLISAAVTLAALADTGPVRDATTMRQHIDSKALREKRRKQISMGHKPDDHEDEDPAWSQKMM